MLAISSVLFEHPAEGADCNENGLEDVAEVLSGRSRDCNENGVPDDCDVQPVNPVLELSETIPAEDGLGEPVGLSFAELDADGDLDLIAILHRTGLPSIQIVKNDGAESFAHEAYFPLHAEPASHIPGDLDGDGDLDVAVTYYFPSSSPYAAIHWNQGDGSFPTQADLPLAETKPRISAADVDGDGALDLFLGGVSWGLTALRNQRGGGFSSAHLFEDRLFGSLGGGDLDGDGDVDLAAMTDAGTALLVNGGAGDLSLRLTPHSSSAGAPVVEDLDGDGDLDLALALPTHIRVLLNRGDAAFDATAHGLSLTPEYFTDANQPFIVPADLDADGRVDLLAHCVGQWTSAAVSFLRNLGGGVFARGTIVAKGGGPRPMAFAAFPDAEGVVVAAFAAWNGASIAFLRQQFGGNSPDCDGNGMPDDCDAEAFGSADCDHDGVPDACQLIPDCNGNGLPDRCDILSARERDCNASGSPDSCDVTEGRSADRGGDGVPDECQPPFSQLFRLGFEDCPDRIQGAPGEVKTFEVFPTLAVAGDIGSEGPQGWNLSIFVEGTLSHSITFEGVHVATCFDHDGDPLTPPVSPFDLALKDAGFRLAEKGTAYPRGSAPPELTGVVSSVYLDFTRKMTLLPGSVNRLAKITCQVKVPPDGQAPAAVRLRYEDGLIGSGTPMPNVITLRGMTWSCPVEACAPQTAIVQPFLRCDTNDDLRVDLSDAIWTLRELFDAGNQPKTRCQLAADCNGDGRKDISDPISALSYLFSGGRAPPLPFPGCGTGHETGFCDPDSTACR